MSSYPKSKHFNWRSLFSDDSKDNPEVRRSSKYRSSLGWGSELSDYYTDYYSNRFLNNFWADKRVDIDEDRLAKEEELITKAYVAARDMIVILNFPYQLNIQLLMNDDESGIVGRDIFANGSRRIFIPTSVLDNECKTDSEKINIVCGAGIHESAHLLFTERSVLRQFEEKVLSNTTEKENSKYYKILFDIVNLLEDSRVEDKLLTERPGFLDFIGNNKTWNFEQFKKRVSSYPFISAFYSFLRFPEFIDKKLIEEHSEFFEKIGDLLSEETPEDTKETCILAKKIYKILIEEKKDLLPDYKEYKGGEGDLYNKVLYGFDVDSYGSPDNDQIAYYLKKSDIIKKLVYGKAERGDCKNSFFEKISGNQTNYNLSLASIKKYIPTVKNLIKNTDKNYKFNIYGCRSGLLDTTKLAEAYQGVPQVYVRQGQVVTNKTTVCILVDESGSMYDVKERLARDAVILLNEALGSLPGIDLYIYGHSADEVLMGSVDIKVYREGKKYNPKYALSEVRARSQNRDGDAILEVAKRVRKYTQDNVLMFVISDGEPCAGGYWGRSARKDTKEKVKKAEKLGFNIIQITIDNVNKAEDMFDKYIDIKDSLSELPKKLSGIIKKSIVDDKNTVII